MSKSPTVRQHKRLERRNKYRLLPVDLCWSQRQRKLQNLIETVLSTRASPSTSSRGSTPPLRRPSLNPYPPEEPFPRREGFIRSNAPSPCTIRNSSPAEGTPVNIDRLQTPAAQIDFVEQRSHTTPVPEEAERSTYRLQGANPEVILVDSEGEAEVGPHLAGSRHGLVAPPSVRRGSPAETTTVHIAHLHVPTAQTAFVEQRSHVTPVLNEAETFLGAWTPNDLSREENMAITRVEDSQGESETRQLEGVSRCRLLSPKRQQGRRGRGRLERELRQLINVDEATNGRYIGGHVLRERNSGPTLHGRRPDNSSQLSESRRAASAAGSKRAKK